MKMFIGAVLILTALIITSCDTIETDNSSVSPLPASKIDKLVINGNEITATVVYTTPTPCWSYHHSEKVKEGNNYIIKGYGMDTDQPCILVIDSISMDEKITFTTSGEKRLRFWSGEEEFLDTLITIP